MISLRRQWTVAQAEEHLRSLDDPEMVHYLYVVDVIGRLIGVVPIRNLILAQLNEYIEHIMIDKVIPVSVSMPMVEGRRVDFTLRLYAIPVVGDDDKLLGVITVDDALDVLKKRQQKTSSGSVVLEPLNNLIFLCVRSVDCTKSASSGYCFCFFSRPFSALPVIRWV